MINFSREYYYKIAHSMCVGDSSVLDWRSMVKGQTSDVLYTWVRLHPATRLVIAFITSREG